METETTTAPAVEAHCLNCAAALVGPYCQACGQEVADPIGPLHKFVVESFRDAVDPHGPLLSTIILLFTRPGELTRLYLDGVRARQIWPLQIYVTSAAAFFLVSTFHPMVEYDPVTRFTHTTLGVVRAGGQLSLETANDLARRGISGALFAERFGNYINANMPTFLFGSVILFILALAVFYNRHRMRLLAHAVFALHWVAFYMCVMIVDRFIPDPTGKFNIAKFAIFCYTTWYMAVALRHVYREAWWLTVVKTVGLIVLFNIALAIWIVSVVDIAFRSIG